MVSAVARVESSPVYPPPQGRQSHGGLLWHQQLVEASLEWICQPTFVSKGPHSKRDGLKLYRRLGEMTPWLSGVSVIVYNNTTHPQPFGQQWGVDRSTRTVWIEEGLVRQQVTQQVGSFEGHGSWAGHGWAELWVRVAHALGAPQELFLPLFEKATTRSLLDKDVFRVCWPTPGQTFSGAASSDLYPALSEDTTPDRVSLENVEQQGWTLYYPGSNTWNSPSSEWLIWAEASQLLEEERTTGQALAAGKLDGLLTSAIVRNDLGAFNFWINRVPGGLENRLPSLLAKVKDPAMVAPLIEKGASVHAPDLLVHVLDYTPAVVDSLMEQGISLTIPGGMERLWSTLAGALGSLDEAEWPFVHRALEKLEQHGPPPEKALCEMIAMFQRNQSYRPIGQHAAANELAQMVERWVTRYPTIPLEKALVGMASGSLALEKALTVLLNAAAERGLDLNTVAKKTDRYGQEITPVRLPVEIAANAIFRKEHEHAPWRRLWENHGVSWETTASEREEYASTETLVRLDAWQKHLTARRLEETFTQRWAPALPTGRKARM